MLDFRTIGGWGKFELVRVLKFLFSGGCELFCLCWVQHFRLKLGASYDGLRNATGIAVGLSIN